MAVGVDNALLMVSCRLWSSLAAVRRGPAYQTVRTTRSREIDSPSPASWHVQAEAPLFWSRSVEHSSMLAHQRCDLRICDGSVGR